MVDKLISFAAAIDTQNNLITQENRRLRQNQEQRALRKANSSRVIPTYETVLTVEHIEVAFNRKQAAIAAKVNARAVRKAATARRRAATVVTAELAKRRSAATTAITAA